MQENGSFASAEDRQPPEGQATQEGQTAAQDALDQDALDQDALDQDALDQDALDQDALDQDALDQDALDQDALDQDGVMPGEAAASSDVVPPSGAAAPGEAPAEAAGNEHPTHLDAEDADVNAAGDGAKDAAEDGVAAGSDHPHESAPTPGWPVAPEPPEPPGEPTGETTAGRELTPFGEGAPIWPLVVSEEPGSVAAEPGLAVPWTLRQAATGTALTLVPWLIFAIGAQLAAAGEKQPVPHKLSPGADLTNAVVVFIISALLEGIFLIAPLIYASRTVPPELHGAARLRAMLSALGLRPIPVRSSETAVAVAGAIGVILVSSYVYDAIIQRLHLPLKTNADALLQQAKYEPYTVIATLLVAVLVAPICEEIFFRGFLFPGLARGMAIWAAVVVSALLFGLAHADLGSFVVLAVIGAALAVVRWRTESLWPGVIVHTLNNAIALVGILVLLHQ